MSSPIDICNANPEVSSGSIYELGNSIPAWSPSYTPKSDLITAYSQFLEAIDLKGDPNPNLDALINRSAAALSAAQDNYSQVFSKACSAFSEYIKIFPDTNFSDFTEKMYPVYGAAYKALIEAQSTYYTLLAQRGGPGFEDVQQALSAVSYINGARNMDTQTHFNMPVQRGTVAPAGSTPTLPGQTVSPAQSSMTRFYAPAYSIDSGFFKLYEEWQAKSVKGIVDVGPIKLNGTTSTSDWSSVGWSSHIAGGFSFFFSFWGEHSSSQQNVSENWSSSNYEISVSFTGLATVPLHPGPWMKTALIQRFREQLRKDSGKFFGEEGCLGLLPTQAIIGFEPKITLTLDNAQYSKFKTTLQTETTARFAIGPFFIGGGTVRTYGEKQNVSYSDDSCSITLGPVKSSVPLLLGVISTKL